MSDIQKSFKAGAGRVRPPYWRDIRSRWFWIVIALAMAARWYAASSTHRGPEALDEGVHEVRRVVDGDTLLLANGARVRLEGIDTPETVKENTPVQRWGPEASQFSKDFVERAGGRVRLTFPLERRDQYDRFLAFVWNGEELLNQELIRAGLAHAKLGYNYSSAMKRRFADAQKEAQREGRGIWSHADHATPLDRQ
jgi:micrococcal nuclease